MITETQEDIFVQWTCPNCETYSELVAPIFENIAGYYASFTCETCYSDFEVPLTEES